MKRPRPKIEILPKNREFWQNVLTGYGGDFYLGRHLSVIRWAQERHCPWDEFHFYIQVARTTM